MIKLSISSIHKFVASLASSISYSICLLSRFSLRDSISSYVTWDEKRAHKLAEEAAERLFEFKWMPPGRGLWMMGTPFIWEKGGAALNNCAFVSTEDIDAELSKSFAFPKRFKSLSHCSRI